MSVATHQRNPPVSHQPVKKSLAKTKSRFDAWFLKDLIKMLMGVPRLAKNAKHLLLFLFFAYQAWKKSQQQQNEFWPFWSCSFSWSLADDQLWASGSQQSKNAYDISKRAQGNCKYHSRCPNYPFGTELQTERVQKSQNSIFFTFPKKESLQPSIFFC